MSSSSAFSEWASLLGQPQVLDSAAARDRYGNCTTGIERRLAGALRPLERSQIPAVIGIAARFKVALYPISTGHNWGYGTALPPVDDCVILDLSGLDRILHFDSDSGVVTLDPGGDAGPAR